MIRSNTCCGSPHPWDQVGVESNWRPAPLRCLIIAESPGKPGAAFFYDDIPVDRTDPIEVRRYLLSGLAGAGVIDGPSLKAFKKRGLLFDHAIRCQLPTKEIKREWRLAKEFRSDRAHRADHLKAAINGAPRVWVMGRIARDAVVHLGALKRETVERDLDPPFVPKGQSKFFVSRYVNRFAKLEQIIDSFKVFMADTPGHGWEGRNLHSCCRDFDLGDADDRE